MVTGEHTATGRPIVAGDPHRFIENPGVYQQIRLTCPEFDVVGFAVPGVPGIPHFGHAGDVAWAITNAMADYQDLYHERLRGTGSQIDALGPDGWRPAAVHTETIEVAGGDAVQVEVIETERGPVIADGISFRHPPRVTGELGFDALPALLRATSVADVDRAFDRWVEPVNVVLAADTSGGLLHRTAGRVPVRDDRNRFRIVPAWESRHEWRGWHDPMPRAKVDGIAVMANERGLAEPLGVDFAPPHRAKRIRELLAAREDWTARDMAEVHNDTRSGSAPRLIELLPEDHRLRKWDCRMDADSTDAAEFAAVRSALVRRLAEHPVLAPLGDASEYPEIFGPWLAPIPRIAFGLENLLVPDALPGVVLTDVLKAALEDIDKPKPWGETHRLTALHAFGTTPLDVAVSGDVDCVLAASSLPGVTDECWRGPVARYVWDLARREDSLWVVPLGASGVPADAHHHDQTALWVRGELIPVGFVRHLDGFGTVRIVPVDPERDIDLIYSWVTEERARFWGMGGNSRDEVLEIYRFLDSLDTHHAYLLHRDDRPVALFQSYQPGADPIGECYEVQPGDIGAHFLVGPGVPEPGFTGTLFDLFIAFLLADPTLDRVVVEPDVRNDKAIARLLRSGFVLGPEIALPDKRAYLAFLTRK